MVRYFIPKAALVAVTAFAYDGIVNPTQTSLLFSYSYSHWKKQDKDPQSTEFLRKLVEYYEKLATFHRTTGLKIFEEHTYRLEWMILQMKSSLANEDRKSLTFAEQGKLIYDTEAPSSYYDVSMNIMEKIEGLLPGGKKNSTNIFQRFEAYRWPLVIPQSQYEEKFRFLVDSTLTTMAKYSPEIETTTLEQVYIDDPQQVFEASCAPDPVTPGKSTLTMNIARPITYDKAQQLVAHELTHHLQFVLMQRHVFPNYPEMKLFPETGPLGLLLEGGAEYLVDLIYPTTIRVESLLTLIPSLTRQQAEDILALERLTWEGLWPVCTAIARDLVDEKITLTEAEEQLQEVALKARNSWPNVEFFQQYGAYVLGYGWGKELIRRYLRTKISTWEETGNEEVRIQAYWKAYMDLVKRPVTPGNMWKAIIQFEEEERQRNLTKADDNYEL